MAVKAEATVTIKTKIRVLRVRPKRKPLRPMVELELEDGTRHFLHEGDTLDLDVAADLEVSG